MRRIRLAIWQLGLGTALLMPAVVLAQTVIGPVNPTRLDGVFVFVDQDQGANNTLEFTVDGTTNGILGQVQANAGGNIVTITYRTGFPNQLTATAQHVGLRQDRQVLIGLDVDFADATPDYFGEAAPVPCKVQAKMQDNSAGDPDSPDKSQATLTCDLGSDYHDFDDDADEGSPGDPPAEVLTAIEQAFAGRKDVQVRVARGTLKIKHKGEPD